MSDDSRPLIAAEPARLYPDIVVGALKGSTDRYEKRLSDLAGVYRDATAFDDVAETNAEDPVYWVEASTVDGGDGALTIGVSTLTPGRVGDEHFMTRGHIHRRHGSAEMYFGLRGRGVMLMETIEGESRAVEITPGIAVHVPGHWVHRSVNVGDELFITLFCYPTEAGQDYDIIENAGGMKNLVVTHDTGWTLRPNPDHRGYSRRSASDEVDDL